MKLPRFSDIFSVEILSGLWESREQAAERYYLDGFLGEPESEGETPPLVTPTEQVEKAKIPFDNTIRAICSTVSYGICFALWLGEVISLLWPVTVVYFAYGALHLISNVLLVNTKYLRRLDFLGTAYDLGAISCAVYFTGGPSSALYFIYFIPIILDAFHRDWSLMLFDGVGSVFLYSLAILFSMDTAVHGQIFEVGARLAFMFLTVLVAACVVQLLRKQDRDEEKKSRQMKMLIAISHKLNCLTSSSDLTNAVSELVEYLNRELSKDLSAWCRILLLSDDARLLNAVEDPGNRKPHLRQDLLPSSCPALRTNRAFILNNAEKEHSCPTETFSFGSHVCMPVSGLYNESFGVIFAGSEQKLAFRPEEIQFFKYIGKALGLTIQRLKQMEVLRSTVEMDSCAAAAFLTSTRTRKDTFGAVIEGMLTILKAEQASLMLWDADSGLLTTRETRGPYGLLEMEFAYQMGEGIPGRVLESGEAYYTTNMSEDSHYSSKQIPIRAFISLPLLTLKGEPLGVVNVSRLQSKAMFSQEETNLASTFAARAALAIENFFLHKMQRDGFPAPSDNPPQQSSDLYERKKVA